MNRLVIMFLMAIATLGSGCGINNIQDGEELQANEGLFGFVLKTNYTENSNPLMTHIELWYRDQGGWGDKFAMSRQEDLFLVKLKEGNYQLETITFGSLDYYLSEQNAFSVHPRMITYGGHVTINMDVSLACTEMHEPSTENNLNNFKARLSKEYPKTATMFDIEEDPMELDITKAKRTIIVAY